MLFCTLALAQLCVAAEPDSLAVISVHNPTNALLSTVVNVPTGRIAAPGLIDWSNMQLICEGEEISYSIREGQAHWNAQLTAPVIEPRAEDILTFTLSVPSGATDHIHVVEGVPAPYDAVSRSDETIEIYYDSVQAVLDKKTGMLSHLTVQGVTILHAPMDVQFLQLQAPYYEMIGGVGPGYQTTTINVHPESEVSYSARLVSESSSGAMTELHWILEPETGPAIGLSYRVYASGTVEIIADERPWGKNSPWTNHAVQWTLPLNGDSRSLPYYETRAPFYGFKDHAAAFQQTGQVWHHPSINLLETGEESVNGRVWKRTLVPFSDMDDVDAAALVHEGLVITVKPLSVPITGYHAVSEIPGAEAIRERLETILTHHGLTDGAVSIDLVKTDTPEVLGIDGDGFIIRQRNEERVELVAGTVLGLYQAVRAIADHLTLYGSQAGLPLIAANPVVPLRASGFGGGNFEVDFPYGTEDEWKKVFDDLLDSGMNILTCLGMWGNWKMPVRYQYMPELYSDDPNAYDESTGVIFSELDAHRSHALELTQYIQERGGHVWLWLPIGCVPTTFSDVYPEAMMPGVVEEFWGRAKGVPCFTHEKYTAYLKALLKELIETYPIDGLMLVRDDNGVLCECDRCSDYVAGSRTRHAAWEQYLIIYDMLRELGFQGGISVYPYFDAYTTTIEETLPDDLLIVGHGSSIAGLTRRHDLVGHMPDTWLDNLYTNFRLPSAQRVRRLLSDRGTFWIGGAYCGTELPWQGIGYFGWEPTSTPNTFRYIWALRALGREHALAYVAFSQTYEHLWDINARWMCPDVWMKLDESVREQVMEESQQVLGQYRVSLDHLRSSINNVSPADLQLWPDFKTWIAHIELFPVFFEYHLHRLDQFAQMHTWIEKHKADIEQVKGLPAEAREAILDHYAVIYEWGQKYAQAAQKVPGAMMQATRHMTLPYKEWMAGYDAWLDPHLALKQFSGTVRVLETTFAAGEPFTLRIELTNMGVCPWVPEAAQFITIEGAEASLGLPEAFTYAGEPIVPGERGIVEVSGTAPDTPGKTEIKIAFYSPYRAIVKIDEQLVELIWE